MKHLLKPGSSCLKAPCNDLARGFFLSATRLFYRIALIYYQFTFGDTTESHRKPACVFSTCSGRPRTTRLSRSSASSASTSSTDLASEILPRTGGATSPLHVVVCCVHKSTQILTDWRHLQNPANSGGAASPLPAIRHHMGNEDVVPPVWINPARSSESKFQETIVPRVIRVTHVPLRYRQVAKHNISTTSRIGTFADARCGVFSVGHMWLLFWVFVELPQPPGHGKVK